MKQPAVWKVCPGTYGERGRYYHSMRDYCTNCAPYWEQYAACPTCPMKLHKDSGYCEGCRKYFTIGPKPEFPTEVN